MPELLELQLSIEQINPELLVGMAEERLTHFNAVLKEQSERLGDEVFDIKEPFIVVMSRVQSRKKSSAIWMPASFNCGMRLPRFGPTLISVRMRVH